MAEIIKFPDRSSRKNESIEEKKEERIARISIDQAVFVLNTTASLLRTIPGDINGEVYRKYLDQVVGYSDEELIGWLNSATKEQITEKPIFFHALIDESRQRKFWPNTQS